MRKGDISELLRTLAQCVEDGYFDHISMETLDEAKAILATMLDVDITYEQASRLTGKNVGNLYKKVSTSTIQPKLLRRTIKLSDAIKIRDKQI